MESPPEFSETLSFILQYLRAEGFYAAEEALVSELENRNPDRRSPSESTHKAETATDYDHPHVSCASEGDNYLSTKHSTSADKYFTRELESYRESRAAPPSEEDRQSVERLYSHLQGVLATDDDQVLKAYSEHSRSGLGSRSLQGDADEYIDQEDAGYTREYIKGQAAFEAKELHPSVHDSSRNAMQLYRQAKASQNARSVEDDGCSSTGRVSSHAVGVMRNRSSTPLSQISGSSKDRTDNERLVTLTEPVNAKANATPTHAYIVPPSPLAPAIAESPPQTPQHQLSSGSLQTPSTGPDCHAVSHYSSEFSIDSPLCHEPSLKASFEKVDNTAEEGEALTRPEGGWTQGLLYPFGVLGRMISGRSNSAGNAMNDSAGSLRGPIRGSKAIQALDFGSQPGPNFLSSLPSLEGLPVASRASQVEMPGDVEQTRVSLSKSGNDLPAILPDNAASGKDSERIHHLEDAEGRASSRMLGTPKNLGREGEDAAFSFPVTPASEPPSASEPGSVFKTWPSFRKDQKGNHKSWTQGGPSRESSEYDLYSGYSTDEGTSAQPSERDYGHSSRVVSRSDLQSAQNICREPNADSAREGTSTASASPKRRPQSVGYEPDDTEPPVKTPLGLEPLDTGISLPSKLSGLTLNLSRNGSDVRPEDGCLQAYQPSREGAEIQPGEDFSNRSDDLTVRTIETTGGAAADVSTARASTADHSSCMPHQYDEDYVNQRYEVMNLKVFHTRFKTGFEESRDLVFRSNDLVAGRYQVTDSLGSAAFSHAVQALDTKTNTLVCLKVIKNNKDYLDQSLDEIKLLKYVNEHDPRDEKGILQLFDYFYYKEHLFLVTELLRANLYEFQKFNREQGGNPYFTLPNVQSIARQVLRSLAYMHSLDLIHCDLKPENILIKSFSRCEVKVIDLGSSCFTTDLLSSYVQSRSYRAPEVILGLPYSQTVDIWSLGCILAELLSGFVLFQNDSLATLLARLEGILGPIPSWMQAEGCFTYQYFTLSGAFYEQNEKSGRYELLRPKRTSLKYRIPEADEGCIEFLSCLLSVDPHQRPTAREALEHPWLQCTYSSSA